MFQWDKSMSALDVATGNVIHLFSSMREVQLALPGLPAQQSSAFLCQYKQDNGVGTAAVFHLHKSRLLAFYFSEPRIVPESKIDSLLDQGLNFVESMGFLLTDQDIHLLDAVDQEMLWSSLPLRNGLEGEESEVMVAAPPKPVAAQSEKIKPKPVVSKPEPKAVAPVQPEVVKALKKALPKEDKAVEMVQPKEAPPQEDAENVDDLLAAVEAMRAKRPGLRARKSPPTADELDLRRQQLRENVGRILASL